MAILILDARLTHSYKDVEILWLRDPNRYRATLWGKSESGFHSRHLKTLWSKDAERLQKRVFKYIDKISS